MNKRILYVTEEGISVIVPITNCGLSVDEIARKDVPRGRKYKIINVADVPSDKTFHQAWEIDEEELNQWKVNL